jgi:hypothetical protein
METEDGKFEGKKEKKKFNVMELYYLSNTKSNYECRPLCNN